MEGKLFVYTGDTDCFDYYSYDLISNEKHCIYKNMAVYTEGTKYTNSVSFTGGRYDLVKMGDIIYLGDEMNGKLRKIEGLTKEFMNGLINETGDKIIISHFEDGYAKQLGILDVPNGVIYMFDRKVDPDTEEYGLGWKSKDTFAISAADQKLKKFYVYLYQWNR